MPETVQYKDAVFGSYMGQIPKHYVFHGFEHNQEFQEHLKTLLSWETEKKDGLRNMGVIPTEDIKELEGAISSLIEAANTLKDMQVNIQASIDSLRHQFFKLMEATDKNQFLQDNRYIYLEMLEL